MVVQSKLALDDKSTSLISLIGSPHGDERMDQRRITEDALKAAKKYGTRCLQMNKRWRFEYQDVVFVTELDQTTVVTCYAHAKPLYKRKITAEELRNLG